MMDCRCVTKLHGKRLEAHGCKHMVCTLPYSEAPAGLVAMSLTPVPGGSAAGETHAAHSPGVWRVMASSVGQVVKNGVKGEATACRPLHPPCMILQRHAACKTSRFAAYRLSSTDGRLSMP